LKILKLLSVHSSQTQQRF